MIERTLVMVKPNAVKAGLVGEILRRYEIAGLRLLALKAVPPSAERVTAFYEEHCDRPFFDGLVAFMSSGPTVVIALEGEDAVAAVRRINGATDPAKAEAGTIRADFAPSVTENAVHGSDGVESAAREIDFWFGPQELVTYDLLRHRIPSGL